MRIAYLLADQGIPFLGTKGASAHARAITQALSQAGHDVVVFAASLGEGSVAPPGLSLRRVSSDPFLADWSELVLTEASSSGALAPPERELTGLCLNEAFRQALLEEHELRPLDLVLERASLWSFAGARVAEELGLPLILELNAPLLEEQQRHRSLVLAPAASAVRRAVFGAAAAVVAVSEEVAESAVAGGAEPSRVSVLANGFDPERFPPLPDPAPQREGFTVGFLGTLKPWHGIETLCAAFERVAKEAPEARLLLVGDGPMRGWVESFAARSGLGDRVELRGALPHEKIAAELSRFDVATAPYQERAEFYFSPLKLYEYMGLGLPMAVSRVGQVESVLEHDRDALLVTPGDAEELAAALLRLRADRELRRRLGRCAAELAHREHRWSDVAERLLTVIGESRRPGPVSGFPRRLRDDAGRVGYVLKRYPRLSETFIVNELIGVESAGQVTRVLASSSPKEERVHPSVGQVRGDVVYLKKTARRRLRKKPDWLDAPGLVAADVAAALTKEAGSSEDGPIELAQAGIIADEARRAGLGHLHAHFATSAARMACLASRMLGISFSFTAHAKDIFRHDVDQEMLSDLLDRCAFVVAISDYHRDFLRERHASVRIEVVRNGLDLQRFPWQGERPASSGPLRVLAIGRLIEKKGFDDLVEACALMRQSGVEVDCRIVGEGEDRAALEERIAGLGLEGSCTLQGACTQDELPGYLAWASALAAPCVTAESGDKDGLPTVILEAMAAGLPVVSTPVTAIPEIVRDGETGLLVAERDPSALAAALQRLEADHAFARGLATAGRAAIEELHDNRKSGARLAALFREAARCR